MDLQQWAEMLPTVLWMDSDGMLEMIYDLMEQVMRLQKMQPAATVNVKKDSVSLQVAQSVWGWHLAVQPMQKKNEL